MSLNKTNSVIVPDSQNIDDNTNLNKSGSATLNNNGNDAAAVIRAAIVNKELDFISDTVDEFYFGMLFYSIQK